MAKESDEVCREIDDLAAKYGAMPEWKLTETTAMDNQQKPLSELIQKLRVSSIVIRNLPEMPGYNGSILTIGDTEANEIADSIDAVVDGFEARLAAAEAEIRTDEYTIADLNHQIDGFKGRIAELEQQLEEAQMRLAAENPK